MAHRVSARLTAAEGRRFALTVASAFLVLGAVALWRERALLAWPLLVTGGLLAIAGIVIPGRLSQVYRVWMGFALLLSKVTTPVFMGIVYFVVVLPIGLARRAFGSRLSPGATQPSYWTRRPRMRGDLFRQF